MHPFLQNFLEFLLDKQKGWTIIAVSNDPKLLKILDHVIVIDQGEIIDAGSYDELSKRNYAPDLFNIK